MVRKMSKTVTMKIKRSLIAYHHPESKIAEQFRSIRSHIQFASAERKVRSLFVTSPGLGEGKTMMAVNLALSMAQRGDKVLLIDEGTDTIFGTTEQLLRSGYKSINEFYLAEVSA